MLEFAAMNEFQAAWLLVYLYEAMLFFYLCRPLLPPVKEWKKWQAAVLWVLLAAYIFLKWKLENYILPNILVMIIYGSMCLRIYVQLSWRNIPWLACVFAVCVELGRTLVYGSIYITGNYAFYQAYDWLLRILVQALKWFFVWCCRRTVCRYAQRKVKVLDYTLIILAISQVIFMHYRRRISVASGANLKFEVQTFLMLGFGVCMLVAAMIGHITSSLKQEELNAMQQAIRENYAAMRRQSEIDTEISRMRHDLKQQIAAMNFPVTGSDEAASADREQLANRLLKHVDELQLYTGSGSVLLDSLLNEKLKRAREKEVDLQLFLETVDYSFLEDMDLCSIFGNAVDNALEAAEQVSERERRYVRVKTALLQGVWVLKVENSCTHSPVMEGENYISSKPGPKRNGIGISSIRYCAKKYCGKVEIAPQERIFTIRVTIPVVE